jgi:formiminotetrahydrofolate cyclodeaminase
LNLKAADLSADEVIAALGSVDEPAAAGSAAALTGAFAAAIVCKAARAASRPATAAQAISLQDRLLRLARADAEVLAAARAALESREGPAGERRDFALGQALRNASVVPAGIAETCADVAQLAAAEHEYVEPDFTADVTAAAILAAGAAQAAASLVAVNLLAHDNEADVVAARHAATTAAEVVAQLAGL